MSERLVPLALEGPELLGANDANVSECILLRRDLHHATQSHRILDCVIQLQCPRLDSLQIRVRSRPEPSWLARCNEET